MASVIASGDGPAGPDGALVVLAFVAALVVIPLVVGLVLRIRDRAASPHDARAEERPGHDGEPYRAPLSLSGTWGRNARGDDLTFEAWRVAIAMAAALAVAGVVLALTR